MAGLVGLLQNPDILETMTQSLALDVRSLVRACRTCTALSPALRDDALWAAVARALGLEELETSSALADHLRQAPVFSTDGFGAVPKNNYLHAFAGQAFASINPELRFLVHGSNATELTLGSGSPVTRRVAAAHVVQAIRSTVTVDFWVNVMAAGATGPPTFGHAILWLGILYDKRDGRALDGSTLDEALRGYDVCASSARTSMAERFSGSRWSMNAVGSSGAVWADGSVGKLLGADYRFGSSDKVRLTVDMERRELRVQVFHFHAKTWSAEVVAIRRLIPRGPAPAVHLIAHLTDVASPDASRRVGARVFAGRWMAPQTA